MDELVRKLIKYNFFYQKALHVESCLIKRIFTEIYAPRMGVFKFFALETWSKLCQLTCGLLQNL